MIKTNELPLKTGFATSDSFLVDMTSGTGRMSGTEAIEFLMRTYPNLKALAEGSGGGLHNSLYRGKALGSTFTAAQANAIDAGTFDDLYVGDYWDMTTAYTYYTPTADTTAQSGKTYYADVEGTALDIQPTVGSNISGLGYCEEASDTQRVIWRIADFNTYLYFGDTGTSKYHLTIVPDGDFQLLHPMNPTATTEGGYPGSQMRREVLPRFKRLFLAAFGAGTLCAHREYILNAVDATTGKCTGGAWMDSDGVELMGAAQVFGSTPYSYTYYSSDGFEASYMGIGHRQLSLFQLCPEKIICKNPDAGTRYSWWLRDVLSASRFGYVSGRGHATSPTANNANGGVRPAFTLRKAA